MTYPIEIDDWIIRVAQSMARSQPNLAEDAAQEGRVAAWEAWNGHRMPEDVGYAKAAARKAMLNVVTGQRRMLGSENARVKIVHDTPTAPEDLPDRSAWDVADGILMAYHQGEIHAAVNDLPLVQRRAAHLVMFDQRWTKAEKNAWYEARKKLQERLVHLKGCE